MKSRFSLVRVTLILGVDNETRYLMQESEPWLDMKSGTPIPIA